jgi:hypothetical protein
MTIEKLLPLQSLQPGRYVIRLKVNDRVKNQTLTQSSEFSILGPAAIAAAGEIHNPAAVQR